MREGQKKSQARRLRKNMTEAEKKLWYWFRNRRFSGTKFRRQYPIGPYIVDFVCLESFLVIELDGSQHASQASYDAKRDHYLKTQGFTVLRFWNNDVLANTEGVLTAILAHTHFPSPGFLSPGYAPGQENHPLPQAGEGKKRSVANA